MLEPRPRQETRSPAEAPGRDTTIFVGRLERVDLNEARIHRLSEAFTALSRSLESAAAGTPLSSQTGIDIDPALDPLRVLLLVAGADGFTPEEAATIGDLIGLGFSMQARENDPSLVTAFGEYLASQSQLAVDPEFVVLLCEAVARVGEPELGRQVRADVTGLISAAASIDGVRSVAEQRLLRALE